MGIEGLILLGFQYIGTCNCGGGPTKKYLKDKWLIYVTAKRFKVKYDKSTVKNYENLSGLKAFIQETFQDLPA